MTECREFEGWTFKAANRPVDIFVGRVDIGVAPDDIINYIKEVFIIDTLSVTKLEIKSEIFNAFKVSIKVTDRDKLFNAELWPEDIIVNKFYNRVRNSDIGGENK